ncbi:MAG: hypothetical protein V4450_10470 [Bacteroidota bacterium]
MSYTIPPAGSHLIPLDMAVAMTTRYRANMDDILKPELVDQGILAISETFNKELFLQYLQKDTVAAFRIYYGMSEDLQIHAIIVGVDKDGHDILPQKSSGPGHPGHPHPPGDGDDGEIFEDGVRCPSYCPPQSHLNTNL